MTSRSAMVAAVMLSAFCIFFILLGSSTKLFANADDGASKGEEHQHHPSSAANEDVIEKDRESKRPRINILNLDELINPQRSGIVGLGIQHDGAIPPRLNYDELHANDMIEDSFYDPFSPG